MKPWSPRWVIAALAACAAGAAAAAPDDAGDWLPWVVLGGIALFVAGVVVRMIVAARFPQGYRQWARARRDTFAKRNDAWDRADDEFRR